MVHLDLQPAPRPLHVIFLLDCSASMSANGKFEALNAAMQAAVVPLRAVATANPQARILVRTIRLASEAAWHQEVPTPADTYEWRDLPIAAGTTNMAAAIGLATAALRSLPRARRYAPLICLVTDGPPDSLSDFDARIHDLTADRIGEWAIRIAIGLGAETEDPMALALLERFGSNTAFGPLSANNARDLMASITFVATDIVEAILTTHTRRIATRPLPPATAVDPESA